MSQAIFFDRDGVLLKEPLFDPRIGTPSEAINNMDKFEILDAIGGAFVKLIGTDYRLFVISNQDGIEDNLLSWDLYETMNQRLNDFISTATHGSVHIEKFFTCPHSIYSACECRKPNTGLINQALLEHPDINIPRSWVVGDRQSDIQLGKNIGSRTIFIQANHSLTFGIAPLAVVKNVEEAVNYILQYDNESTRTKS